MSESFHFPQCLCVSAGEAFKVEKADVNRTWGKKKRKVRIMNGFLAACKTAANDHSPAVCQAWQQPAGIYLSPLPEMSASSQVTVGPKTTPFLSDSLNWLDCLKLHQARVNVKKHLTNKHRLASQQLIVSHSYLNSEDPMWFSKLKLIMVWSMVIKFSPNTERFD